MFATCSFPEFNPETMPGVPVRTANGFPRYKLKYPLIHKMPSTFPHWPDVKAAGKTMSQEEFNARYVDMVAQRERRIRDEVAEIQGAEQIDEGTPIVLLCFEQLHRKGEWCHRTALAAALKEMFGLDAVPEYGGVRSPEIGVDQGQLW